MIFFLPPIASVILFFFLWREDMLPQPHVVVGCVLVGVARTAPRTDLLADLVRRSPVERQRRDIPGDPSEVEPIAGGAQQ